MPDAIIKVEGLGKKYTIGHMRQERYTALRDVITNNVKGVIQKTKELLTGKVITEGDEEEEFWALRDVSFKVEQGERIGIIGRNGAGKSTLLKILSRITEPSNGRISIRGRVASLLEVGTGFHPELSGRENIYLNGAILGMSRAEIRRKFDEIVDFAEVERFLDTPVKRYSSGMYVRLAFAVAAHLESEILIIDEVLAVGDAQFQQKCFGKMEEVSAGEGRTVLFVSHNMDSIIKFCPRSILLHKGQLRMFTDSKQAVNEYLQHTTNYAKQESSVELVKPLIRNVVIDPVSVSNGRFSCTIEYESPFVIERPNIGIIVNSATGNPILCSDFKLNPGLTTQQSMQNGMVTLNIHDLPLRSGNYSATFYIGNEYEDYDVKHDYLAFEFISSRQVVNTYQVAETGPVQLDADWEVKERKTTDGSDIGNHLIKAITVL